MRCHPQIAHTRIGRQDDGQGRRLAARPGKVRPRSGAGDFRRRSSEAFAAVASRGRVHASRFFTTSYAFAFSPCASSSRQFLDTPMRRSQPVDFARLRSGPDPHISLLIPRFARHSHRWPRCPGRPCQAAHPRTSGSWRTGGWRSSRLAEAGCSAAISVRAPHRCRRGPARVWLSTTWPRARSATLCPG